jgi:hypothetical protein
MNKKSLLIFLLLSSLILGCSNNSELFFLESNIKKQNFRNEIDNDSFLKLVNTNIDFFKIDKTKDFLFTHYIGNKYIDDGKETYFCSYEEIRYDSDNNIYCCKKESIQKDTHIQIKTRYDYHYQIKEDNLYSIEVISNTLVSVKSATEKNIESIVPTTNKLWISSLGDPVYKYLYKCYSDNKDTLLTADRIKEDKNSKEVILLQYDINNKSQYYERVRDDGTTNIESYSLKYIDVEISPLDLSEYDS